MRNLTYIIGVLLLMTSCKPKIEYLEIVGKTLDVTSGDVYLISPRMDRSIDTIATSKLVDGNFHLLADDLIEQPKVGIIRFIVDVDVVMANGDSIQKKIGNGDVIILENKK